MRNILIVAVLALCGSCATVAKYNPVGAAETFAQKAFATYGIFTVMIESASSAYSDPRTSIATREALQTAVEVAEPLVDAVFTALVVVEEVRSAFEDGHATEDELREAADAFGEAVASAMRAIQAVSDIVEGSEGEKI